MGSRRDLAFLAFSAACLALLVALGVWQLQRLQWKESLIARMGERISSEPRGIAEIEARHAAGEDVEFLRAAARGRFVHDRELFVFATSASVTGWKVVTPLEMGDGKAVLVDRGFIPYEMKDPATRPEGRQDGAVSVIGAVRPYSAPRAPFAPDNDVDANVWHWWALSAMAEAAGIERASPFILQAEPGPGDTAWPRASRLDPATIPNRHLGYAVTWFGLAAMLVAVNGLYLFRRRDGATTS